MLRELEIHQMKAMECFFNSVRIYDKIIKLYKQDYNNCMIARELGISVTNVRQRIEKFEKLENIVLKTKNVVYISKHENAFEAEHIKIIYKMLIDSIKMTSLPLLSDKELKYIYKVEKEIVDTYLAYAIFGISKAKYQSMLTKEEIENLKELQKIIAKEMN